MALGICKGCGRFARGETCPFCGSTVAEPVALPRGRRNRLGRVVAPAAVAAFAMGCSSADVYGGPPIDASLEDRPVTFDAAYGGPPMDAPFDTGVDAGKEASTDAEAGPSDAGDGG